MLKRPFRATPHEAAGAANVLNFPMVWRAVFKSLSESVLSSDPRRHAEAPVPTYSALQWLPVAYPVVIGFRLRPVQTCGSTRIHLLPLAGCKGTKKLLLLQLFIAIVATLYCYYCDFCNSITFVTVFSSSPVRSSTLKRCGSCSSLKKSRIGQSSMMA